MKLTTREKQRLKTKYGEWAIVTGASSGIGRELAIQLAGAGFNLIITARNKDRLQSLEQQLKSDGHIEIKIVDADVSEPNGIEKIIAASKNLNIGLLINNAGFGTSGSFIDSSLHFEINMLRVNCEAVVSLTHYFSRRFVQQKRGGIIFLSSLVAFQAVPYAAHYAATKAFIQSFAEALNAELKPFGVDVLAAAPGPVKSGFEERANMKMDKALLPSQIVAPILKALGRKRIVIPGMLSKLLVYSLRTVPGRARVQIMKKVMGGMTKHQRG